MTSKDVIHTYLPVKSKWRRSIDSLLNHQVKEAIDCLRADYYKGVRKKLEQEKQLVERHSKVYCHNQLERINL